MSGENGVSIDVARNILGNRYIISAEEAASAIGIKIEKRDAISLTEEQLRFCALENSKGAEWTIIYIFGYSLQELRLRNLKKFREEVARFHKKEVESGGRVLAHMYKTPGFSDDEWWLSPAEISWSEKKSVPGYYCIELRGISEEKELVVCCGDRFERADITVLSEAVFTAILARDMYTLRDAFHFGNTESSVHKGVRVGVGRLGYWGWNVVKETDWIYDRACCLSMIRDAKTSVSEEDANPAKDTGKEEEKKKGGDVVYGDLSGNWSIL